MSRHRTVRTMNYDDEYDGYYDEYGHSVEDDYCISPSTAAQFMFDRNTKTHSMSAFLNPESITEEEEEKKTISPKSEWDAVPNTKINQIDQQKLHACVESMQNVVGETIPESLLVAAAIGYNYNLEQALDAVLSPGNEPPKPQRIPRKRNRMNQDTKTNEEEKPNDIAKKPEERVNINFLKTEQVGDNQSVTKEGSLFTKDINEDEKTSMPGSCNNSISPECLLVTDPSNERITPDKEKPLISENSNTDEAISTSRTSSKLKSSAKDLLAEYQKERGDSKPLINMVVIGHVDAGKSTLMGHLLYRLGCVGKKTIHKYEQDSKKLGKASFMYAWVLDETNEERNRGITMDVAQSRFETPHHVITLLDAPGHKDFIPNMITGAAQADVAVLVVDATRGEFETGFDAGGQTREHTMLVRSLGVSQLAVAVNKLDNVEWCKDRYNEIICKLGSFLKQTGYRESDVTFVPCSGLTGENLTETAKNSSLTSWYNGPCLVEVIDKFKPPERPIKKPLRLCISDVYKGMGSGFCVAGRIEAGHVQNADRLIVMPAAEPVSVKGISIDDLSVTQAYAGDHVVISLLGGDINKVTSGSVLCDLNQPIKATNKFQARIVAFNIEVPITKGYPVILHQQSMSEQAVVKKLVSQLHKSTGQIVKKKPRCITKNSSAVIELEVNRPICLELYKDMRELGRFMLRSGGTTIAAGVVTEAEDTNGSWHHHPIFQRFWSHYTQSCYWYKHHLTSQQLLHKQNCYDCCSKQFCQDKAHSYSCGGHKTFKESSPSNKPRKSKNKRKHQSPLKKENETDIEMEVTEEFFKFLEETEKHRQQQQSLKRKAQKNAENAENPSHSPPKCREITLQRSSEMKILYGTAAAKIHGMETAMQLTFDRYSDLKQPKLWPNIPLNM